MFVHMERERESVCVWGGRGGKGGREIVCTHGDHHMYTHRSYVHMEVVCIHRYVCTLYVSTQECMFSVCERTSMVFVYSICYTGELCFTVFARVLLNVEFYFHIINVWFH